MIKSPSKVTPLSSGATMGSSLSNLLGCSAGTGLPAAGCSVCVVDTWVPRPSVWFSGTWSLGGSVCSEFVFSAVFSFPSVMPNTKKNIYIFYI